MTSFDDRRDSAERKYALDEEGRFRAMARRNKLLGLWVAETLGQTGSEADDYARSVVAADFAEAGDDDVLRKVRGDLEAGGRPMPDAALRAKMDELMATAVASVQAGR